MKGGVVEDLIVVPTPEKQRAPLFGVVPTPEKQSNACRTGVRSLGGAYVGSRPPCRSELGLVGQRRRLEQMIVEIVGTWGRVGQIMLMF